jgi:hypothetical protein
LIKRFVGLALIGSLSLGVASYAMPEAPPDEELHGVIGVWGIPLGKGSIKIWRLTSYEGQPAMRIVAAGETTGILSLLYRVKDSMESYCHSETFQPYVFRVNFEEGKYRRKQEFIFDHAAGKVRGSHGGELDLVEGTHDPLSATMMLRTTPLEKGATLSLPICDGRKVYNIALHVRDREPQQVLGKKIYCWVLEPEISSVALGGILGARKFRHFLVWVTDDDRRIPAQARGDLVFGSLVARLQRRKVLWGGP